MEMTGSRLIAAPQAEVWRKLNDADVLKRCIPGCESLEKTDDTHLKATAALRIGPMAVRFSGEVELQNLNPPNSYRIAGSGKGGPAGYASGYADVKLEPQDGGTLLSYAVNSTVGGKIAQLGGRLIDATAAALAGQFFDSFSAEFAPPATAAAETPAGVTAGPAGAASGGRAKPAIPPAVIWIAVAAVAALAIYALYAR
jgi:uncharacterized protein